MTRAITAFMLVLALCVAIAASAQADPAEYALESVSASTTTDQAGAHPDFNTFASLKLDSTGLPFATTQDLAFDIPPGLLANPSAAPKCTAAQLISADPSSPSSNNGCPQDSQIGVIRVVLRTNGGISPFLEPIYNMQPDVGEPARFGFIADVFPVFIDTELRPDHEYGITAVARDSSSLFTLISASTTIWGVPAAEIHDSQRITPYEAINCGSTPCTAPGGENRSSSQLPTPFVINPTRCDADRDIEVTATPYALPDLHSTMSAPLGAATGCGLLDFQPRIALTPTSADTQTGSGLDVHLSFPQDGLQHTNLLAEAAQKRAEVLLPAGVTVNPSYAAGLAACSPADFAREAATSAPGQGCPEASKIGTASAITPLLEEPVEGSLYVATPHENPFGSLLALYLILRVPDRGVVVKLAGKVSTDPQTGQLSASFDDIPQIPVSSFDLHFRGGARAPLATPQICGTYGSTASFTSWSGQVAIIHPSFEITSGTEGGPCPAGVPPFHPGLEAGTLNNAAGSYSPFYTHLTRKDSEQEITHFSIKLPPGVAGILAGIPFCSDASIVAAEAREHEGGGGEEEVSPSCPKASEIGHSLVGSGVGSMLAYVPGKVYLAGPYHGSNLSIVSITAAKVGPFDLGTVVVRFALRVNPETAEVFVDSQGSDPIPHIVDGIPVHLRDIRAYVDRPHFIYNPTSCAKTSTASTVLGSGLNFASEADDQPVTVTSPFQAADCASLGFKPQLKLNLIGSTKRGGTPALRATLLPRAGDANSARVSVQLPHSEFLDQSHIGTVCTRVQFKAGGGNGEQCPAASIYGHARAFTPIFDESLEGPIYLRSSEHPLPDLVLALHGLVDFDAVGRIDSVHGGIRNTFDLVPDVPLTKVVVNLEGGKKGLLENSTNLCKDKRHAIADFTGQNGKVSDAKPVVAAQCPKGGKGKKGAKKSGAGRVGKSLR